MPSSRVASLLRSTGGVATWGAAASATSSSAVGRAVASGAVVIALPGVLVAAAQVDDELVRTEAALLYAGQGSLLSHVSALTRYGLPVPQSARDAVHVLVPHDRRRRTTRSFPVSVVVHRSRTPAAAAQRGGFPVTTQERAVVDSWPLLRGADQRAPALVAVRRRSTTGAALRTELALHRVLDQRPTLAALLISIDRGCRSELELWGYERVFTGPRFDGLQRQVEVVVQGITSVLDCYDPRAALAIELDGRQYHDSPRERERDAARDGRLAEVGIQTVRFPHARLTSASEACRESVWRTAETRRAQLASTALPRVVEVPAAGAEEPRLRLVLPSSR